LEQKIIRNGTKDDQIVPLAKGEKFYLRVLLYHLRGLTSWEYLLTNNGIRFYTFRKVAADRGFLETDNSIR